MWTIMAEIPEDLTYNLPNTSNVAVMNLGFVLASPVAYLEAFAIQGQNYFPLDIQERPLFPETKRCRSPARDYMSLIEASETILNCSENEVLILR